MPLNRKKLLIIVAAVVLLTVVIRAESQAMQICVSVRIDEKPISLVSVIDMVTEGDLSYLILEQNGSPVYITDNVLLLRNGRVFVHGENMQTP